MNKSEVNLQIKHYIKNIREIYSETYLVISPSSISFYSLFWQKSTNLEFYCQDNKKPLNIIGCNRQYNSVHCQLHKHVEHKNQRNNMQLLYNQEYFPDRENK